MECELAQLRCETVVFFARVPCLPVAYSNIGRLFCRTFAFFCGHYHLHLREDFVRRQHPIHRNGVTTLRRTTEPQRPIAACSAGYLDLPASNNPAANQAVTFFVERTPVAKLIEPPQRLQFVFVG